MKRAGAWAERSVCVLLLMVASCTRTPTTERQCPPCAVGFARDPQRHAHVIETWQRIAPELGRQSSSLDLDCACYGGGPSVLVEGANLLLPSEAALGEQTARAVHLALHRVDPPWTNDVSEHCPERVERAVMAEARAHVLELEVCEIAGCGSARYPFAVELLRRERAERVPWMAEYFRRNPGGDGVVPGFVLEYRARCESSVTP